MLSFDKPVVVEGKYDQIKLSGIVDSLIVVIDGFAIFKDKIKQRFLKELAAEHGIILLTDSDSAGFMLRHFITDLVGAENVTQVYIPDVFGKEKRKAAPGKEGKLGVEGTDDKTLIAAFERAGLTGESKARNQNEITPLTLYELGFSGRENSAEKRKALLKRLGFPERMNTNSLLKALNMIMGADELKNLDV